MQSEKVISNSKLSDLKKLRKYSLFAALLALTASNVHPAFADNRNRYLTVGDTIVRRIAPMPESDSVYVAKDYTEVHFKVNKFELNLDYMDNGKALLRLDRAIDSLGIENITAIEVISQSSPEGPLRWNQTLTENRSKVITDYINRVFPELSDRLSVNKVAESWENLAMYVDQDPNLEEETRTRILEIIDSDQSVEKKKSLMEKSLGSNPKTGNVYNYLYKYYYPVIRNSGIYILHMVKPEPAFKQEPEKPYLEVPQEPTDTLPYQQQRIAPEPRKRPFIAVKTNLAYDAFFTKDMGWAPIYNIEAELYPTENGRWTWLYEHEFPWHVQDDIHQYLQIINIQLEARRYFKKASNHTGHYLSAYLGGNIFDICFDRKGGHGYQGEGGGAGLGYGYVMPLGKQDSRWKLEFFVKGGFYMTYYDPYDAGSPYKSKYYYEWFDDPSLFVKRNWLFRWFGPTGAGITLSYDLIHKKVKE